MARSLAHCLKKAGDQLSEADKKELREAAQAYRDEGFAAEVANVSAVEDVIQGLEEERADILRQAGEQGWTGEEVQGSGFRVQGKEKEKEAGTPPEAAKKKVAGPSSPAAPTPKETPVHPPPESPSSKEVQGSRFKVALMRMKGEIKAPEKVGTKPKAVIPEGKIKPPTTGKQESLLPPEKGETLDIFEAGVDKVGESNIQYIYAPSTPQEQLSLFDFKPVKREKKGYLSPTQRVRVRTTGTITAAGNVISDNADAASLLASIRKSAQENLYTITVNKEGRILEIHRYAKGVRSSASIFASEVAGRVLNVTGASKTYIVHNHPSGDITPSAQDREMTREVRTLLDAGGIEIESLIIGIKDFLELKGSEAFSHPIPPAIRKITLPVVERFITDRRARDYPPITSSVHAKEALGKYAGNADGVMLLNAHNHPLVFVPFIKGRSMKATTRDILQAAEKTVAQGFFINLNNPDPARMKYAQDLYDGGISDLQALDLITNGVSSADAARPPTRKGTHYTTLMGDTKLAVVEGEQPYRLSPKQFGNVKKIVDQVEGWLKEAGLGRDVVDRVTVDLKPIIDLSDKNVEESIRQWEKAGVQAKNILGATTFRNYQALVELALYAQDIKTMERTTYHEAFHLAARWVLPEAEYKKLLKHYGTEEKSAEAFANYVLKRKVTPINTPGVILRIFLKIRRLLRIVRNGLNGLGFSRPEDIFGSLQVGAYRTHFAGGQGSAVTLSTLALEGTSFSVKPASFDQGTTHLALEQISDEENLPTGDQVARDIEQNRSFVNRLHEMGDLARHRVNVQVTKLQRRVQEMAGKPSRKKINLGFAYTKTKRSTKSDQIDRAMMVFRDLQNNPDKAGEFRRWAKDRLADQKTKAKEKMRIKAQLRVLEQAENLTEEQKALVEEMAGLFEDAYALAENQKIIQTHRDYYVRRIWDFPESRKETARGSGSGHGFKVAHGAAKERTLETIPDGWMAGYELKVQGITGSYGSYMTELATVLANKAFITRGIATKDANGRSLFTTNSNRVSGFEDYEELKAPGFSVWQLTGTIKALDPAKVGNVLETNNWGKQVFFTPAEDIPEQWAVYKDEDAKRPARLFDNEEEAGDWMETQGFSRMERRPPQQISKQFQKQKLYAPRPIAEMINKMTAREHLFFSTPVLKGALRLNAGIKSWILLSSFFHHLAGSRSWVFGVHHGWKKANPVRAYKDGLKKVEDLHPLVELGVKNGLTLGELQDFSESELYENKGLSEKLANYLGLEKLSKAMEYGRFKRESFTSSLFKKFFAGLKAEAFVLEYAHELQKANEGYTKGKSKIPPNPDKLAEKVARLINADFGGLHLKRMGRNPTLQKVARLLLLAPDWCVASDIRVLAKDGWKYHNEVNIGDEILAFDKAKQTVQWETMKDIYINSFFHGQILNLHNRGRDVRMTPDHRCFVYNTKQKTYETVIARDLKGHHKIPRGPLNGYETTSGPVFSDLFIKLVGWFISDGYTKKCTQTSATGYEKEYRYGKITQAKPANVKLIKSLCLMKYHKEENTNGGVNKNGQRIVGRFLKYVFTIPKQHFDQMEALGLRNGLNWGFLSKLTRDQLEILYETMMLGCGTGQRRFSGREKIVFYMSLIQIMLGWPTTFYQQEAHCWRTRVLAPQNSMLPTKGNRDRLSEGIYKGTIWCPSVDSKYFVAECQGLVFITGNTESNFRTVSGMIPGMNKVISKFVGDIPGPPGMDKVYRKFWGRVALRIAVSTIIAQMLLNGKDETEEFIEEQALTNFRNFKKFRWTGVDITKLYHALGIDTEGHRKTFSLGGHFFDPLKLIDPFRLIKGKGSPFVRAGEAAFSGTDWAGRPFTGAKELITTGKTIKKSAYEKKEEELNRLPATLVNQVVNMQPIQLGHFIKYLQGEEDGLTALLHSMGAGTHTAWKPYIETPILPAEGEKDPVMDEIKALMKGDFLKMGPPSRNMEIAGVNQRLTHEQYTRYLEESSNRARRKIAMAMRGGWRRKSDEERAHIVYSIIRNARKKARSRLKRGFRRETMKNAKNPGTGLSYPARSSTSGGNV